MQRLSPSAIRSVSMLARRFGTSEQAVLRVLAAVAAGEGDSARFNDAELGGQVTWRRDGLTAIAAEHTAELEARVTALCGELARLYETQIIYETVPDQVQSPGPFDPRTHPQHAWSAGLSPADAHVTWYPEELGTPSASGGQNGMHYAVFPQTHRLAIDLVGHVDVFDTLDHHIAAVDQTHGGAPGELTFTSQHGAFRVDSLPRVRSTIPHA